MLFVVATPIGNLEDITFRAVRVLKEADIILCEDTRVTKRLLDHYEIALKKLISYHQHSNINKIKEILELVKLNNIALVTDAGTPGIADPGNKLISEIVKSGVNIEIVPIPGPSAVISALSISGFPTDRFIFKGFVPHKKGREKFLKEVLEAKETVVFYESCHRIIKCLTTIATQISTNQNTDQNKKITVCRELTKKFETIYRGSADEILEKLKIEFKNQEPKGEFVIVVN